MKITLKPLLYFTLGSLLAMGGCTKGRNVTKLQYMPDMADAPTVKPQESFLNPPQNSVPVNMVFMTDTREQAETELKNPFVDVPPEILTTFKERGKNLFNTYCAVCHGFDGKGGGTLGDAYPLTPPDLTRPDLQAKKDGWFFHVITNGGQQMPAYGYAISAYERWWVIMHLRALQEGSAVVDQKNIHVNPALPQLKMQ